MARRTRTYRINLEAGIDISVRYTLDHNQLAVYAVLLLVEESGTWFPVRLYDNAHGQRDLHRYTEQGGKQQAEPLPENPPAQAMIEAIEAIKAGHEEMIRSWRR